MNSLQNIIESPQTPAYYADLIGYHYHKLLRYSKNFYMFSNGKWHRMSEEQIRQHVRLTIVRLLETKANEFKERVLELQLLNDQDGLRTVTTHHKSVLSGIQYVKNSGHLNKIINCLRYELSDENFESNLDKNPYLFALDNGVIDLKTVTFRQSMTEDMITMSAGYDWIADIDSETQQSFNQFIQQIYPIESDQSLVQLYLGYCLLGDHPEQVYMLFKDERDGYTGKSTMAKLIKAGMGLINKSDDDIPSYVATGNCKLLYRTVRHARDLFRLRKVRLVIFEEPDPSLTLNTDLSQQIKLLILLGENNVSQADLMDHRALVVHHRARFHTNESDFQRHAHEPYTYRATNVESNFPSWRICYLKWALDGLRRYWQTGLSKSSSNVSNEVISDLTC